MALPSRPLMGQKGVIMKVLALPVGQLETNCYLLCDVERKLCAVIDPGADADVILENVRENGCDICAILLTHGHDDHVGGVAGIRAACPGFVRRQRGSIVTVSSMWGETGGSCEAAYSAAKAGVEGLTKALAKELGPSHVRVNCVAPGVIETDMNAHLSREVMDALGEEAPLGRTGTAAEAARAIRFLASEESAFITGQILRVDGGMVI